MITNPDSYHRIIEVYDDLSKQQRKIADGNINRYDEIVFVSITQLANFPGVSEAARFGTGIAVPDEMEDHECLQGK